MPLPVTHTFLIGPYAHAPQLNVLITAADASVVAAVLRDPQCGGSMIAQVTLR
ncbi:hypothetical protein [Candidatus Chloroploca asiatica]|uniref:hypothetical protein n=1 Tax=Candidatus Chloroploca asiatica TaxID=1506545 RepID=UPI0015590A82|nr:hypothetical protein [Candidatus Chloroploca asiatica]